MSTTADRRLTSTLHPSRPRAILIVAAVIAATVALPTESRAATTCGASNGFNLCVTVPTGVLTGDVPVSVSISNPSARIRLVDFSWGPTSTTTADLLTDFESPYGFTWRTDRYLDASGWLNVRVERDDGSVGAPVAIQVTLSNGNATAVPQNPRDWPAVFVPRTAATPDPVVAAVGDAGDGTASSSEVAASVAASTASVLLYLGDMYERGTPAEWDANYGRSALEGGQTWDWGALAGWTRPTLGNHEAHNLEVWRDYWHGIPNWETFVYGGVRFLNLNSECALVGGCGPGSAQYAFAQQVLAQNTHDCIVTYWHRPVLSGGADATVMNALWALLANNGGDLVLNGHLHTMQRFRPMNADLEVNQPDSHMVEVISGAGTHAMTSVIDPDPRSEWQVAKVPGVAYLTLEGGDAGDATAVSWEFRTATGSAIAGSADRVACGDDGGVVDTDAPTTPGTPTATSTEPGSVDVSWSASTDDQATSLTYRVYRNGGTTPIATLTSSSTTTVTFRDQWVPAGEHTYEVVASDGLNESARSTPSEPVIVEPAGDDVLFSDGFDGGLSGWSRSVNLALDDSTAPPTGSPPSVGASVSNAPAFAQRSLGGEFANVCVRLSVDVTSVSSPTVSLVKLRTAAGTSVGRIYLNSARELKVRADVAARVFSSRTTLPAGWNTVELCGTVGAAGTWSLAVNGAVVGSWTANNGVVGVSTVQIGDEVSKTFDANFDDVVISAS